MNRTSWQWPVRTLFNKSTRGAPELVGHDTSHFADVAQLVARDVANIEAVGSRPTVRSISGVPVHKHWAGLVCMCAGAAAPACSDGLDIQAHRVRTQPRWTMPT